MLETVTNKVKMLTDIFRNINQLIFEINTREDSEDLIIYLNTEDQLFKNSEDAEGNFLGDYSDFTAELKKGKGQPFKSITLKDSGTFYNSFEVKATKKGDIIITADTIKNGDDLEDRFGNKLVGLNEENISIYREYFKNALLQLIRKEFIAIRNIN